MKKKILILTSAYQRWPVDKQYENDFIVNYCKEMTKYFDVCVLAPNFQNSKPFEQLHKVSIYRHPQFPFMNVSIAYRSGILPNIKNNPLLFAVIPFFLFFQFFYLFRIVKKESIELIHVHWLIPNGLTAALYKFLFNRLIPVVGTAHGSDLNGIQKIIGFKLARVIRSIFYKNANSVTVVSKSLLEIVRNDGFNRKCLIIPMGFRAEIFSDIGRNRSDRVDQKGVTFVFAGRLVKEKGVLELIGGFIELLKIYSGAKLVIAGDGIEYETCERIVKEQNLQEKIILVGFVSQEKLANLFRNAHFLVLPSRSEGFGLVVVEAICSGLVPILSDLPVFNEVLGNTKVGFRFSEISPKNIAFTLNAALIKKTDEIEFFNEIQSVLRNKYSWKSIGIEYKKLIDSTLSNPMEN